MARFRLTHEFMKPVLKFAIIAGGYFLALLMAAAAVALHAVLTSMSGAPGSGGMDAFGDLVLFVLVFGAIALVPTGVGLFFLFSKKKTHCNGPDPNESMPDAGASEHRQIPHPD